MLETQNGRWIIIIIDVDFVLTFPIGRNCDCHNFPVSAIYSWLISYQINCDGQMYICISKLLVFPLTVKTQHNIVNQWKPKVFISKQVDSRYGIYTFNGFINSDFRYFNQTKLYNYKTILKTWNSVFRDYCVSFY